MVMAAAYPNASFFGAGHGTQAWTEEPNPLMYADQLSTMIHQNLQIQGSRLRGLFEEVPMSGAEVQYLPRLDPVSSQVDTQRYANVFSGALYDELVEAGISPANMRQYDEPTGDKRLVVGQIMRYQPILKTMLDQHFTPLDLSSQKIQNGVFAIGRQEDANIMTVGIFGSVVEGHSLPGSTQTTISWNPTTDASNDQMIINSGGVGLSDAKISTIVTRFMNLGIDPMQISAIITPNQVQNFIDSGNTFHLSQDYVNGRPLMNFQIPPGFMGIGRWIVIGTIPGPSGESSVIPLTGTERRCAFVGPTAVKVGRWRNGIPRIYEDQQLNFALCALIYSMMGSVRMEEKQVIEVRCHED
jgi:hypothetical protein